MTQFISKISLLCLAALALTACSDGNSDAATAAAKNASGACPSPVLADGTVGGCRIRLVTPKQCETIDLTGGKSYEFAWTTDGTFCETAWKLQVGGNPLNIETGENIVTATINKQEGYVSNTGGVIYLTAADFNNSGLTSSDGVYHWVISSFHGSHPASVTFRVNK